MGINTHLAVIGGHGLQLAAVERLQVANPPHTLTDAARGNMRKVQREMLLLDEDFGLQALTTAGMRGGRNRLRHSLAQIHWKGLTTQTSDNTWSENSNIIYILKKL